jgi:hypothetical protein
MAQITLNSTGVASSGALALQSNGTTTAVTIDTSQRLAVNGTDASVGGGQMVINHASNNGLVVNQTGSGTGSWLYLRNNTDSTINTLGFTNPGVRFYDVGAAAERMRIDSSGNLLVGTTSYATGQNAVAFGPAAGSRSFSSAASTAVNQIFFANPNGNIGSIQTNGSATSYGTSSDYRLKNTIAPMTGALDKVALLKPCTYIWNADDSQSQGFIAHELQEVVPECVTGEKDAVDADGNPQYQGIDTSFLVATLTAAIQELNAKFEEYKAAHP